MLPFSNIPCQSQLSGSLGAWLRSAYPLEVGGAALWSPVLEAQADFGAFHRDALASLDEAFPVAHISHCPTYETGSSFLFNATIIFLWGGGGGGRGNFKTRLHFTWNKKFERDAWRAWKGAGPKFSPWALPIFRQPSTCAMIPATNPMFRKR